MADTAIRKTPNPSTVSTGLPGDAKMLPSGPRPQPPLTFGRILHLGLTAIASLRVTVVLFALAIFLVFCGTLAQVDAGIWTIMTKYFRSKLFVLIPFQIFFPRTIEVPGFFPYPGGWMIGGLLLINLLAAHATRFKVTWKRSGVLLLHSGLVILMASEFIAGTYQVEGNMTIETGGSANYLELREYNELAIIDRSNPKTDDVVVIPASVLRQNKLVRHDALPFDVELADYFVNSGEPQAARSGVANPATAGDGVNFVAVPKREVTGTDPDQKVDLASAYVTLKRKDNGQPLGTYLVSLWFSALSDRPQKVTVDGKIYDMELRFKRSYKPYTIHLLEFKHELYTGTQVPKNFESRIRLVDPSREEDREVTIRMNEPLRYQGESFFQSGWLPGDTGTILQVVYNPGRLMPLVSCTMIALGMLVHFGINLIGFLMKRVAL
jgi:hypothetical protein